MTVFDRLYGMYKFPDIINQLLLCPGLLRLREIRQANVPFINFPSFIASRYEHSLGVCHLADIASKTLYLDEKKRVQLMIACLYHDVATPPFSHAMEEVFSTIFGFNHEEHLYNLLIGKSEDPGKEKLQVYLGRSLKLHSLVQKKEARDLGLNIFEIANIAIGKGELGSLIRGDIDLDNIDNVIRAASAMGVTDARGGLSEVLARSFINEGGIICFSGESLSNINAWKRIRSKLYSLIYSDVEDFSIQTMLKHAIKILIENDFITRYDWIMTEDQIIYDKIRAFPKTKEILDRIKLCDFYSCCLLFSLSGPRADQYAVNAISDIEEVSQEIFKVDTIVNYFVDRKYRAITRPVRSFFADKMPSVNQIQEQNVIFGIFTSQRKTQDEASIRNFFEVIRNTIPQNLKARRINLLEAS
jgi:HD superfamily phosphohydrolase